mmetsp:Transcript_23624/g.65701  ORF Transcript_23624/g.65701 Transcript_23624/m.65701 type:complete len:222 (-) Transcript_23624:2-667(-)
MYATTMKMKKKENVIAPSQMSTTSCEKTVTIKNNQMYAKMEKNAVTPNTLVPLIFRVSPLGMAATQTALIQRRLKAALPTMVDGPRSPLKKSFVHSSITLSSISGALEPRAMSDKFATVSFQTLTVRLRPVLASSTRFLLEVIFSIAPMKISETMATPMKSQRRPIKYKITRSSVGHLCSASPKIGRTLPPFPGSQIFIGQVVVSPPPIVAPIGVRARPKP